MLIMQQGWAETASCFFAVDVVHRWCGRWVTGPNHRLIEKERYVTSEQLRGKTVAILAADGVERVEVEQPRDALEQAGASTDLLSLQEGEIQARNHDLEPAGAFPVDGLIADASVDDYDILLLPGGTVNPDKLRVDKTAVGFVRDFVQAGKPVAAICHGPWTLVEAGVVSGRTLTSYPSIRTDLRNAGANVIDEEVVRDGNLVTSRSPKDLPAFCAAIVEILAAEGELTSRSGA
jgi:protease I